jgi:energy-coupling factor transport system ATP-binding protein
MARAGDDVAVGLENAAVPEPEIWPRVDDALAAVGFGYGRERPTSALSGGEKQRLAIAGVLADGHPDTVFETYGDDLAAAGVWVPGLRHAPRHARSPAGPVVVSGERLSYRYPHGVHVVAPEQVQLRAGEAVALTGPNGSGKSTVAMLLAGLRRPTTGAAGAQGNPLPLHRWRARDLTRAVGTVFQEPEHQFVARTVAAELAVGPLRQGVAAAEAHARSDALLQRLHLDRYAAANPFTLSGGEKRRLSVATALATDPAVLVLDEPTFGQDARTWAELLGLLADLRDDGRSVLAVTHDEAFADALADRRLALA